MRIVKSNSREWWVIEVSRVSRITDPLHFDLAILEKKRILYAGRQML